MSKEQKARDGAQAVIGADEVLDVALVEPRGSTFAGVVGAVAGMSGNRNAAWGFAGASIGERINASVKGGFPSYVLAVSKTKLYILGRHKTGNIGGWKKVELVTAIDRSDLSVAPSRNGLASILALTDTTTATTLEFEQHPLGNLGLKDLLASLDA